MIGVKPLYREVVQEDRLRNIRPQIRIDLQSLLTKINAENPFFTGKFTEFLAENATVDDEVFFEAYARIPAMTKQDYAEAGQAVMAGEWADADPETMTLQFDGKPFDAIRRLRKGNYLMPMATGGSSS